MKKYNEFIPVLEHAELLAESAVDVDAALLSPDTTGSAVDGDAGALLDGAVEQLCEIAYEWYGKIILVALVALKH